eukprot:scaffold14022_cov108-Isochrysis_galbana.AAC.16
MPWARVPQGSNLTSVPTEYRVVRRSVWRMLWLFCGIGAARRGGVGFAVVVGPYKLQHLVIAACLVVIHRISMSCEAAPGPRPEPASHSLPELACECRDWRWSWAPLTSLRLCLCLNQRAALDAVNAPPAQQPSALGLRRDNAVRRPGLDS